MARQNEPFQVISCDNDRHTLHVERLERIISPRIQDRRLIVVSITGNTGTGKSLMINLLASYLRHLENKTAGDWGASHETVHGMSFEPPELNGNRTLGMFMWFRPFMISTKVAILLADCQGSHGVRRGNENIDNALQLLSLQLADVQLINIERIVNVIQLEDIQNAVNSMLANGCHEFPDDLIFLCRNYEADDEGVYGEQPGAYIMRAVQGCDEAHQEALECISHNFKKLTTFTFPYPNRTVARATSTQKNPLRVIDVQQSFTNSVKKLCDYIIRREGACSTGKSLIDRFKALKDPVENGRLYEGLATAANLRRDNGAMKDFEKATKRLQKIEERISKDMDPTWVEQSMERRYDNDTNRLIEEYDAQSITSGEYNTESLRARIKHGWNRLAKYLVQAKEERKLKAEAYAGLSALGVVSAVGLAATAVYCPPAAIAGMEGLAEVLAGAAAAGAGAGAVGAVAAAGAADAYKAVKTRFPKREKEEKKDD